MLRCISKDEAIATCRQKDNGSWEYVFQRKGLLAKPISLTFEDKAAGDSYAARVEAQLRQGIVPVDFAQRVTERKTLHWAIREYVQSVAIKPEDTEILGLWLKETDADTPLLGIDFDWIIKQIERLKRVKNLSPNTIRKRIGTLSRCLSWYCARKIIVSNPAKELPKGYAQYTASDAKVVAASGRAAKQDVSRDRRLDGDEERQILAVVNAKIASAKRPADRFHWQAIRTLFVLAAETAMRLSEMVGLLNWQVNIETRTISLIKTKNGTQRQVPMSVAVQALLVEFVAARKQANIGTERKDSHFFPWVDEQAGKPNPLEAASASVSRQLKKVFEKAGAKDLVFHDLRHEATSRLHERTRLSEAEIRSITGHKSVKMMMRYTHLRASNLLDKL